MHPKITVIGSTGLVGKQFLESIVEGQYEHVTAITRRSIPTLESNNFIKQSIYDFSDLEAMRLDLQSEALVCALGTTIKTAGSQEAFMRIDHELPLEIAKIALEEGCKTFILISAMGANAQSRIFYSRVKGLLEEELSDLGFEQYHILRPSMLLGDRQESRTGEFLGKLLMQPLSFLIPWKYKPIHASFLASTIHRLLTENMQGKHVWEGKPLFR